MARSQSFLKLFAIFLFGSFFSLFVQNAVAAPITAISISNNHLAGPETFYKRDEEEVDQGFQELSFVGDLGKALPKIVKEAPKIVKEIPKVIGKGGKGGKKPKEPPKKLPAPEYPNLAACEAAINTQGKAVVFYSNAQPRDAAYKFSQSPGVNGIILNNALPKLFLKKKTNVDDPGDKLYNEFLDRASLALAKKSSGTVYFVTSKAGPSSDRIWKRVEEPALHGNSAVNRIIKVDSENFADRDHNYWVRH